MMRHSRNVTKDADRASPNLLAKAASSQNAKKSIFSPRNISLSISPTRAARGRRLDGRRLKNRSLKPKPPKEGSYSPKPPVENQMFKRVFRRGMSRFKTPPAPFSAVD